MSHNELLRTWRTDDYQAHSQKQALLHEPMSFREQFDGVLLHLGRWPYDHIGDVFEVLADRQLTRYANGGTQDQWDADQAAVMAAFDLAGWTPEEFDTEVRRRIVAKLS